MYLQSTQKPQPKEHIMEENLISCVTKVRLFNFPDANPTCELLHGVIPVDIPGGCGVVHGATWSGEQWQFHSQRTGLAVPVPSFPSTPAWGAVRDSLKIPHLPHDHRQGQRLNTGVLAWLRWDVCQLLPAGVPAGNWYAFLRKISAGHSGLHHACCPGGKGCADAERNDMSCTPVLYLFPKATGLITTAVDFPTSWGKGGDVEIQLESRSESTAKLMPEVDTLTLLGRKPRQAVRPIKGMLGMYLW
ncbi:uncharacterized protein LOC125327585 [Corvus hawaiiensis]|uniref:uncharacterized protein LOC125327585 n=1 Tax=Corvus hawaiiensis TaxID=134902 RepID=UPI0020192D39|nr:uncharacterized protein LOC125327585 [Corvus hawaiiensis]